VIATSPAPRLGAIALVTSRDGKRALVAWSDPSGLRTALVDVRTGRPGSANVVHEGGATALAAARDGDGWRLAVVVPDDPKGGGGGAAMLSLAPDGTVRSREPLGPAGERSADIALLLGGRGWVAAWHDGSPGASRVHTWSAGALGSAPVDAGRAGFAPSLARDGDEVAIAWSELASNADGVASVVRVAQIRGNGSVGAPKDVAFAMVEDPDPVLFHARELLRVVFRDKEDPRGKNAYYVADARPNAQRYRVSRADGTRSPSVATCHGTLAAATIRTFQTEFLIGFNRFDLRGNKNGGELQIYSDGVHFAEASLACLPEGYVLAYAEQGTQSRVLFNRATCAR